MTGEEITSVAVYDKPVGNGKKKISTVKSQERGGKKHTQKHNNLRTRIPVINYPEEKSGDYWPT